LPAPVISWGRWAALAGESAPVVDTNAFRAQNGGFVALNQAYVMSLSSPENIRMPDAGQFDFTLNKAEAWEVEGGKLVAPAKVNSGQLRINFGTARFTTSLNVQHSTGNALLLGEGQVTSTGGLDGFLIFSKPNVTMNVRGTLAGSAAKEAGYLFDGSVGSAGRSVVGVTVWSR
jgi:hypothetical protein